MTDHANSPDGSMYAPELRRRADHLVELAAAIERSLVMSLIDDADIDRAADALPPGRRLCRALLERNLHQLHRAADDLRSTALRFRTQAAEFEAAPEAVA